MVHRGRLLGMDGVWWHELPEGDTAEGVRAAGYEAVLMMPVAERDAERRDHEEEVARLREALEFYADRRNNRGVGVGAVYRDAGRRARATLGPCPTCLLYGDGFGQVMTGTGFMDQDGPVDEWETCRDCRGSGIARCAALRQE